MTQEPVELILPLSGVSEWGAFWGWWRDCQVFWMCDGDPWRGSDPWRLVEVIAP